MTSDRNHLQQCLDQKHKRSEHDYLKCLYDANHVETDEEYLDLYHYALEQFPNLIWDWERWNEMTNWYGKILKLPKHLLKYVKDEA